MSQNKARVAIAGATGYVGLDLVYYLSKHKKVEISYLCAQKKLNSHIQKHDKRIKKKLPKISKLSNVDWKKIDILFLSLPNGEAQKIVKNLYKFKHLKFIDLSADFRLNNYKTYEEWYNIKHNAPDLAKLAKYSISEFSRKDIKKFRIIAKPGCYPTPIQLALIPLIKNSLIDPKNIIIDSKSGYSGAGKNYKKKFEHNNIGSSVFAYGIEKHRHMAELDQEFKKISKTSIEYSFQPHLLPAFRGILSSIYIVPKKNIKIKKIYDTLKNAHKKNSFIKVLKLNTPMGSGNVLNTNNCEISICKTRFRDKFIIFSAIDNLVKGASGQAIQNMNLMYNFKETLGLK